MKVLIMNCSPVRDGATAEIIRMAAENLETRHEVSSVCIDDYVISFCRGCRVCHETAHCFMSDDMDRLIRQYEWADIILSVSPSYWADVPGQFKTFIDRCTPWCNTHEPHASIGSGKKGYCIALRTGPNRKECDRIIETINHFYGHMEIECCQSLALCSVPDREAARAHQDEITHFVMNI